MEEVKKSEKQTKTEEMQRERRINKGRNKEEIETNKNDRNVKRKKEK